MNLRPHLFLAENIETQLGEEIRLFDDYYLTRPTGIEKSTIKTFVEKCTLSFNPNHPFYKISSRSDDGLVFNDNYWIVTHNKNVSTWQFKGIVGLTSINLTVLLEWFIHPNENSLILSVDDLLAKVFYYDYYSSNSIETIRDQKTTIGNKELQEFEEIFKLFENHFQDDKDIFGYKRVVNDFLAIKNISYELPFRFLYYFTILETLLTNNNYKNSNNSINFQLQNKLNLVNKRFTRPIDFRKYFKAPDSVSFQTIIEKLYQYRSDIAHGNVSNFDKDLFLLKPGHAKPLQFIHELTRNVILLALKEPVFIEDLKSC